MTSAHFSLASPYQLNAVSPPLNEQALRRIEATHRGFLYQHLFAVGCLLLARHADAHALRVEHDEDVELLFPGRTRYIQVKTRQRPVSLADVRPTLQRFAQLGTEHSAGNRPGTPEFWIVSNTPPAGHLLAETRRLPLNIRFVNPEAPPPSETHSPPAWPNVTAAIHWCIDAAAHVQFTALSPETLTWKLATEVAFASTGARPAGHVFDLNQLSDLFEQLLVALHTLPAAPAQYIPQSTEPDFDSNAQVRLLVGLSGAGTTAWAAHSALHSPRPFVYVDAAATFPTALASTIAREVAAHFLADGDATVRDTVLPGASGLEALSALSRFAPAIGRDTTIVCDNSHLVGSDVLRTVISHAPSFRWLLLAQPFPGAPAVEAHFGVHSEQLGGFSLESIGAIFQDHGCALDVSTAAHIRDLSAGLPLFVTDSARLTQRYYGRDPKRFVEAVVTATHVTSTSQEIILGQVLARLSPASRISAALLSISDVTLEHDECLRFIADSTGETPPSVASGLRELFAWGIVQHYFTGSLGLHDAFRPSASTLRQNLPTAVLDTGRRSLASVLRASFGRGEFDRLMMFFKLAPLIGESDSLVDIANSLSEYIQERGRADELVRTLDDASESPDVEPVNRFWAYDTVTFWKMRDSPPEELATRVSRLATLYGAIPDPSSSSRRSLLLKQMLLAARRRDTPEVRARYRELSRIPGATPELLRVQRYDYAVGLCHCDQLPEARIVAEALAAEYFRTLNLTPDDLFQASVSNLAQKLGSKKDEYEEIKRFADTLALQANILAALQFAPGLLHIWAHKLYVLAHALTSAVAAGMAVVDEMLELLNDAPAARQFMENVLLPAVADFRLLGHVLDVRATYAVVLAYCGELTEARQIIGALSAFQSSPTMDRQLAKQRDLIEGIANGTERLLPTPRLPLAPPALPPALQPARNAPCACGSGLKYKRCCGRLR